MNWEDIVKRKGKKLNVEDDNIFIKFVEHLTDVLIDRELKNHLSRTTSDDSQYKNHEIALREVLYDDLSNNIADRLADAIETVVFKEGRIDYDEYSSSGILVLIEAIDKNEKELESKNLEW